MGGPRLVSTVDQTKRHTPRSRTFADKLQELTLRSPHDARQLETLVDYVLAHVEGHPPPLPRLKLR